MNIVKDAFSQPWRNALLGLVFLVFLDFFVFKNSFEGMWIIWSRSETFAHGFIVPPISLWLMWRKRELVLAEVPSPNFGFLIPLSLVVLLWCVADLVAVNSVAQLAATASVILLVPLLLGYPIFKIILFPLCFLFFSVPLGEFLFPQLMEWTADFTVIALRFSGVPVYREGLQFVIPSGNWSVVEACSGIRYLIASVTVGALFAYLNYKSTYRRSFFVLVSIAVPIFANWIRAYLIVMLGHLSANKIATGVDHIIYGWIFFGIVIGVMFLIGARWSESASIAFVSRKNTPRDVLPAMSLRLTVFLLGVCVILAPLLLQDISKQAEASSRGRNFDLKNVKFSWVQNPSAATVWTPAYKNSLVDFSQHLINEDKAVDISLKYYAGQSYGRKMISSDNALVTSSDIHWSKTSSGTRSISTDFGIVPLKTARLRGTGFSGGDIRLLVWQYYWINGFVTNNDYVAVIYSAIQKILGNGDDSAVVIVSTQDLSGIDADTVLSNFLLDNFRHINNILLGIKK